jgi:asparagine synthase (glutamine-hydrolysing)
VPFLDHRLVELALTLPDRLRIDGDIHKVALRRAFPDLVPRAILERRDKIGFASPEERWLRAWKPALQTLREQPRSEALGLLRPGALSDVFDSWERRRLSRDVLWRVLSVEMWARVSISGERLPVPSKTARG